MEIKTEILHSELLISVKLTTEEKQGSDTQQFRSLIAIIGTKQFKYLFLL